MTQPNQSELEQNKVLKDLRYILETRHTIVKGSDEFTPYVIRLYQYITANYTPNSTVESLNSQIAWLDGKVEEMREEVAEQRNKLKEVK